MTVAFIAMDITKLSHLLILVFANTKSAYQPAQRRRLMRALPGRCLGSIASLASESKKVGSFARFFCFTDSYVSGLVGSLKYMFSRDKAHLLSPAAESNS